MNMRTFCALALSALVLVGCSDDDVTGFNRDCTNLLGTFTATSATVVGTEAGGTTVDLLADGSRFDLAFGQGSFSSTYRRGENGSPVIKSGTLAVATANHIEINGTQLFPSGSQTAAFTCNLDGDVLTLDDTGSSYLFAGTTEAAPAHVTIKAKLTTGI
jgi:hypothetical protein